MLFRIIAVNAAGFRPSELASSASSVLASDDSSAYSVSRRCRAGYTVREGKQLGSVRTKGEPPQGSWAPAADEAGGGRRCGGPISKPALRFCGSVPGWAGKYLL